MTKNKSLDREGYMNNGKSLATNIVIDTEMLVTVTDMFHPDINKGTHVNDREKRCCW